MKKLYCVLFCVLVFLSFVFIDVFFYNHFTRRLINPFGKEMQSKSIELSEFLPFDENSKIVKVRADKDFCFNKDDKMPVLDGATALFPVYSAVFNAMYPEGTSDFDGKDFTKESLLQKRNTGGAFKAIVNGSADIVFCAEPSKKQIEYAKENDVELVLVPIGYEAFVFLVNKSNPVDSLTVEEVKGIYSGKIKKWNEVGGDDSFISATTRPEGSGSQTAFEAFMGDNEIGKKSPLAITGASIGFSFRYYMDGIVENDSVKMLSLNGVYPSAENIRNRSYPIVAQFYAIYRADNDNENIPVLVDWILSDEGQELIEKTGYIRIN